MNMQPTTTHQTRSDWLNSRSFWSLCRRLLPVVSTAVIVWFLLQLTDVHTIKTLLQQADGRWIVVGLSWYLFTNICRAYRFGALLAWPGFTAPLRLLPDMIALSFLNNTLPSRTGELLFPLFMHKRHKIPVGEGLGLLLVVRIFDFLAVIFLFLLFAWVSRAQLTAVAKPVVLSIVAIGGVCLCLLAALPWWGKWGLNTLVWFLNGTRLARRRPFPRLVLLAERVVSAVARVHKFRTFVLTLFWSLLGWLGTFAWFAAFMTAVQLPTPYPFVVIGATFATLAKALPFITIGGFGAHDAGWAFGFNLTGMEWQTAVASGFAVNMLTLLASVIFSTGTVFYIFLKPGQSQKKHVW